MVLIEELIQSLKSNHAANTLVYKYEFNGVSLRKINKEPYDIDPREKTFDSYFCIKEDLLQKLIQHLLQQNLVVVVQFLYLKIFHLKQLIHKSHQ